MLKVHVLDQLHHHRSNVAHGVEVPAGARLLFTNGQVGTKPDGRLAHTQVWPVLRYFDAMAPTTAASRSASSKTIKGALPPSSMEVFFTVSAHAAISVLPTSVEPVNESLRTVGSVARWIRKEAFPEARLPDGRWFTTMGLIEAWCMGRRAHDPLLNGAKEG